MKNLFLRFTYHAWDKFIFVFTLCCLLHLGNSKNREQFSAMKCSLFVQIKTLYQEFHDTSVMTSRLLRSPTVLSDLIKFSWISIKKGRQKIRTTRNFEKALLHRLNRGQKLCLIKGWTTLTPSSNKLSSSRGGDLLYHKSLITSLWRRKDKFRW